MCQFDYLLVGAGLYNSVMAYRLRQMGKKCLIIDRRDHIAGNAYTQAVCGIDVHVYGPHIFHTSDAEVWNFVNAFSDFLPYIYSPLARYKGRLYNLPFNMHTFYQVFGTADPDDAQKLIQSEIADMNVKNPSNLEEQAISMVGTTIYRTLVKGYTEKQWGRPCRELPASVIKRLPLRFVYDNNYFNDRYQGIPAHGYTSMIMRMIGDDTEVILGEDFNHDKDYWMSRADHVVYTGAIDELCGYRLGALEYRSLRFETETIEKPNHQGIAVINETDAEVPYTRVIEHKHFRPGSAQSAFTVISSEYPERWKPGAERYYPVNDEKNDALYRRYVDMVALRYPKIILGGRLGLYRYLNMDQIVKLALSATLN